MPPGTASYSPQAFFAEILTENKKCHPVFDQKKLGRAFDFCLFSHQNQKRDSGDPYWIHPASVALTLAKLGADTDTICASCLHDILEDTQIPKREIQRRFGSTIAKLVEGMTKLEILSEIEKESNSAANLQKIMLASSKDWRVMVIKLADRLHNLQTLEFKPSADQKRIATETLMVYVPIAHKLGIHGLMYDLQDAAFRFLDPEAYSATTERIRAIAKNRERSLASVESQLKKKLPRKAILSVQNRTVYKLYAKMKSTGREIDSFSDVTILKIETDKLSDCYLALGELHHLYPPVPRKVKDYIATPQPNLYAAIHTTVIGPNGRPIKAHIATKKMFDINNRGVLGLDKEAFKMFPTIRQRVEKLNRLFSLPKHFAEADEFMSAMDKDFLPNTILVFTTTGQTVELPLGSTAIDFVFYLDGHSAHRLWKIKINGKFCPLDQPLEAGDIVEIIYSKERQINPKWVGMAKTQIARKSLEKLSDKKPSLKNIDLVVYAQDRIGMVSILTEVFALAKIRLLAISSIAQNGKTITHFNLGNLPEKKIVRLVEQLGKINGVLKIKTVNLNE